jgi:hypothetical protein
MSFKQELHQPDYEDDQNFLRKTTSGTQKRSVETNAIGRETFTLSLSRKAEAEQCLTPRSSTMLGGRTAAFTAVLPSLVD